MTTRAHPDPSPLKSKLKKQQSTTLATRRPPTNATLLPRPTSEFGWQLALQNVNLASPPSKGLDPLREETQSREPQPKPRDEVSIQAKGDGKYDPLHDPPPNHSPDNELPAYSASTSHNETDITTLSRRYAKKDIGWQLGLQNPNIPPIISKSIPEEEVHPVDGNSAMPPAENGPESQNQSEKPAFSAQDVWGMYQFDLDSAAQAFPSFSSEHTTNAHGKAKVPSLAQAPPSTAQSSSQYLLVDLSYPSPPVPKKDRRASINKLSDETFDCQQCKSLVQVTEIGQISVCNHVLCYECLSRHIEHELDESRFPVSCPLCIQNPASTPGVVTAELVEQCGISPRLLDIFQEYQLSAHSTRLFCPKCQETMLVDRQQYLEESIITCPLRDCGHRWCKLCLKAMPTPGNTRHKCKPDKKNGVRPCPGCGTPGRRLATDNHIKCRGIGCKLHFCFRCGGTVAIEEPGQDVTDAIRTHYRNCVQYQKSDKCTIM